MNSYYVPDLLLWIVGCSGQTSLMELILQGMETDTMQINDKHCVGQKVISAREMHETGKEDSAHANS